MNINKKLRQLREMQKWSQEEMAEKMGMSPSGYAKIERGENSVNIERLEQIAQIFNVDVADLTSQEKGIVFVVGGVGDEWKNPQLNYYGTTESIIQENEKLKLTLSHKDELLAQKEQIIKEKEREINTLNELVKALKK